jgi:sterol desaturase/sphingolipid hydroxylase (fatty acid hydroxylase superfamily)
MNASDTHIFDYSNLFTVIGIISVIFYILTIIETIFDVTTTRRTRWQQTLANITIEIGNRVLDNTIIGAIFLIGFLVTEQFAFSEIPVNWWTWMLVIICVDFTYYWMHRVEHEVRILWAGHSVHHSSQEYNLSTALRLSWVESVYEWIFFIPLLLVGFDAIQILASLLIVVVYQTWIHTEKIGRLGWLEGILNTPSVHRVHHAINATYIDKNYGGILIIWDRLFGTYQCETEAPIYGITRQLDSANPLVINFQEFGSVYRDVIQTKGTFNKASYALQRPGWKPNDGNLKTTCD